MVFPNGRRGTSFSTGYEELPELLKILPHTLPEALEILLAKNQTIVFPEDSGLQYSSTNDWTHSMARMEKHEICNIT